MEEPSEGNLTCDLLTTAKKNHCLKSAKQHLDKPAVESLLTDRLTFTVYPELTEI